ncbi:MAG: hypothetical protein ACW98F_00475 [Candidatus Hodarchaeales archaeon]|jgi:hypothetical protein
MNYIFGNLEFFDLLNYSYYWKSKYWITRVQIEVLVSVIIALFFGITIIQIIIYQMMIEFLILEYISFFVCLRLTYLFMRQDFKNYIIKAEIIGYFVLHELLIILETSKSMKDATKFIITSNYPIYSKIFGESLIKSHFGLPLSVALGLEISNNISGELRRIFLNVIDTWEAGVEIAKLSTNTILSRLSEYIREETDKVDTWGSLFSGLIFLSPPVILCFLLLSGQLNYLVGLVLISLVFFGSLLFRPDKQLSVFASYSPILSFTDSRTIEFLVIHAENLSSGMSYTKSLNNALNIYIKNSTKDLTSSLNESIISFRLGMGPSSFTEIEALKDLFSSRTIQILTLIEKFSHLNTKIAGTKLLLITNELNKTGKLLRVGKAKLKAISFQSTVIQIFSLLSLGFISGASPLFQLISISMGEFSSNVSKMPNFDPIHIFLGFLISILPLNFKFTSAHKISSTSSIIVRVSRFLLFLLVFVIARETLELSFY